MKRLALIEDGEHREIAQLAVDSDFQLRVLDAQAAPNGWSEVVVGLNQSLKKGEHWFAADGEICLSPQVPTRTLSQEVTKLSNGMLRLVYDKSAVRQGALDALGARHVETTRPIAEVMERVTRLHIF